METISQQLTELVNQKNALAENLTTKGITASSSETLNTLVPKVLEIQGGGGDNKFSQLVDRSITTVTAEDLEDITSIGRYAFYGCSSLTSITISETVTSIGGYAFYNCTSLPTITIPESVNSIRDSAFSLCTSLQTVDFGTNSSLQTIEGYAFSSCENLQSVDFGTNSSLQIIKDSAFNGCYKLTTITIPETVTSIWSRVFGYCRSLTTITIPAMVTHIGSQAFLNCSNLQTVIYQGQAPNIQTNCFSNCSSITKYDFRNCTTVPTLASVNSLGHATGCQIIIPDALYDDWTTATNWVSLTGVTFVKASEYTE